ncbi:hypothetical protein BZA05DRAFT_387573 [Tricharina praecox]|uniref:uncharacterized protein n=1 Tax=Tricharina praecox TaxID=43433 RepID=UPI002220B7A3|nr:uncharacterized protein BZA05DRAFT_387573 [Tricharina praecox]KAI5857208.1 hypothetical protein BZA05DRAFT_387573 [Tricharina praecox]
MPPLCTPYPSASASTMAETRRPRPLTRICKCSHARHIQHPMIRSSSALSCHLSSSPRQHQRRQPTYLSHRLPTPTAPCASTCTSPPLSRSRTPPPSMSGYKTSSSSAATASTYRPRCASPPSPRPSHSKVSAESSPPLPCGPNSACSPRFRSTPPPPPLSHHQQSTSPSHAQSPARSRRSCPHFYHTRSSRGCAWSSSSPARHRQREWRERRERRECWW